MELDRELLKIVEGVAGREGACLKAVILYGSRVSGYARRDSDYDVIAVLERFPPKIRYYYEPFSGVRAAILAVEDKVFESDILESSLGDFVSGRLLTPFRPITNYSYVRKWEVAMKRRVALEELSELAYKYKPILEYMKVEPVYILLHHLKKRARMYPPVGYSYSRMLSGCRGWRNLESVMDGFIEGLRGLEKEGYIEFTDGYVKLLPPLVSLGRSGFSRFREGVKKLIKSYVTHTYAGTEVFLKVFLEEFTSKLTRTYRASRFKPSYGDYVLLETCRGVQPALSSLKMKTFLEKLGFRKPRMKRMSHALSSTYLVEEDGRRIVVKRYGSFDLAKWLPVLLWSQLAVSFDLDPEKRLLNEYLGLMKLRSEGIVHPHILAVNLRKLFIVRSYIEGETFDKVIEKGDTERIFKGYEAAGRLIGVIHSLGCRIGDVKPSHLVLDDKGEVYLVDLEQFRQEDRSLGWDLAELLYLTGLHAVRTSRSESEFEEIVEIFAEGYLNGGGRRDALKDASSAKYYSVFAPLAPAEILFAIKTLGEI